MSIYTQYSPVTLTVTSPGEVNIPFAWQFDSTANINVVVDDVVIPTSAYTIRINDVGPGGTVVITADFNNAQAKPVMYTVIRNIPLTQPDVYRDRAQISSVTLEGSLNRIVMQIQEQSLGSVSDGGGTGLPDGGTSQSLLGGPSTSATWRNPTEVANSLPFASASQAGVVKVGSGLSITSSGVLYNTGGGSGGGGGATYHSELLGRDDLDQHSKSAITGLDATIADLTIELEGKASTASVNNVVSLLDGKAALVHTHSQNDVTNLTYNLATITSNVTNINNSTILQGTRIDSLDASLNNLIESMQWLGAGSLYNVMTDITDPTTWTVPATSNYLIMCLGAGGGGGAGGNTVNGGGAGIAGGPTYVWRNSTSQTICWGGGGPGGGGGGIHGCGGGGGSGEAVYRMVPLTKGETLNISVTVGGEGGGDTNSSNTLGITAENSGTRLGGIGGTPWQGGGGASGAGNGACWIPSYGAGIGGGGGTTSAPMRYAGYGAGGGGGGGGGTGGTSFAGLGGVAGSTLAENGAAGSNTSGLGGAGGQGSQGLVILMYYDPAIS